jgi:AraC-like DNA-binding protein
MLKNLANAMNRFACAHGGGHGSFETAIAGFSVHRATHSTSFNPRIYKPALCIVAQGAKSTMLGRQNLVYRAGQALLVSLEMPLAGRVAKASETQPFLGITWEFDLAVLREVFAELDLAPSPPSRKTASAFVIELDRAMIDCILRALALLETPKAIPILYRSIMREMCYRLLTGPHAADIAKFALPGSSTQRVSDAIHLLRARFTEPLRVGELAKAARMSPSSFHQHFKSLTSLSPLQYQKQLRLLEARRLMISGEVNAETAAYQVGYESPSQFSREYSRMFGAPPRRDVVAGNSLRRQASLVA